MKEVPVQSVTLGKEKKRERKRTIPPMTLWNLAYGLLWKLTSVFPRCVLCLFLSARQFPGNHFNLSDGMRDQKLGNYLRNTLRSFLRIFCYPLLSPLFFCCPRFRALQQFVCGASTSILKPESSCHFSEVYGMATASLGCCRQAAALIPLRFWRSYVHVYMHPYIYVIASMIVFEH